MNTLSGSNLDSQLRRERRKLEREFERYLRREVDKANRDLRQLTRRSPLKISLRMR